MQSFFGESSTAVTSSLASIWTSASDLVTNLPANIKNFLIKKTSSSLKFCQDFVNVQVFTVDPGTVPENRHFLRKVNPITVVVLQTNLADLVVYQSGRTGNFVTMKLIATRKRK